MPDEETPKAKLPPIPMDTVESSGDIKVDPVTGSISFITAETEEVKTEETADQIKTEDSTGEKKTLPVDTNNILQGRLLGIQKLLTATQEKNDKLVQRITELEKKEDERTRSRLSEAEDSELNEVFNFLDDEAREKVKKYLQRKDGAESISEDESEKEPEKKDSRLDSIEARIRAADETQTEAMEVLKIYDGKDGRMSLEDLAPFVEYANERFPELAGKVPMKTFCAFAELAPYMSVVETRLGPEKFSALTPEDAAKAALYVLKLSKDTEAEKPKEMPIEKKPEKIDLAALRRETASLSSETGTASSDGPISEEENPDPRDEKYRHNTKQWIEDNLARRGM